MAAIAAPSATIRLLALLCAVYVAGALFYAGGGIVDPMQGFTLAIAAGTVFAIMAAAQIRWAFGPFFVILVSVFAQAMWARLVPSAPLGEFAGLWREALSFAAGLRGGEVDWSALRDHEAPAALALYGGAISLFGEDYDTLRQFVIALWTLQFALLWGVAAEISELRERSFAIVLVFGLSPTIVLFGAIPGVEAVFGVLALLSLYLVLSHRRLGLALSTMLSGVFAALAFLAQPTALGYGAALLALLLFGLLTARNWRLRGRMTLALAAFCVGLGLGYAPRVLINHEASGDWSLAPGPALPAQLLHGVAAAAAPGEVAADRHVGFVDPAGAAVDGAQLRQAEDRAWDVALQRLSDDPLGIGRFAVTEKMRSLWSSDTEALRWGLGASPPSDEPAVAFVQEYGERVLQGVFVGVLFAAFLGLIRLVVRRGAVRDPARWLLVLGAVVGLALTFLLLDARERLHLAFSPLLALLTPIAFARLPFVSEASLARRRVRPARVRRARPAQSPAPPPRPAPAAGDARPVAPAEAELPRATEPPGEPAPEAAEIAVMTMEDRLATVLRRMTKPPRPQGAAPKRQAEDAPVAAPAADSEVAEQADVAHAADPAADPVAESPETAERPEVVERREIADNKRKEGAAAPNAPLVAKPQAADSAKDREAAAAAIRARVRLRPPVAPRKKKLGDSM